MPKITDAQRDARRKQILEAALRCFSRDGFHATTTADIVRESGVSQGTLYLYFATKDDIVVALGDDRHQADAFLNALAQSEPDPVQGLRLLVELYGRSLSDPKRREGQRVGIQGWAEALRNPRIHRSVVDGHNAIREAIVALVERGQASGQIQKSADPDAVARSLIALCQGLVLQVAWGEPVNLPACGRIVFEMIDGALLTPEARAASSSISSMEHQS